MTQTSKAGSAAQRQGGTPIWRAAKKGDAPRAWFVECSDGRVLTSPSLRWGRLVRFASQESAQVRADALNAGRR